MSATIHRAHRAVRRVTPAMEDYLKAVYRLRGDGEAPRVTTQRLADELGISSPSVTNMVKRLHELGLLRHTRYHGAELTAAGERIALEVVRHHRLLERYLAEADRLEHHISEEMEARMEAALGHPTRDPHGDPIPAPDGAIAHDDAPRLADLAAGEAAVVRRVSDRDPELLRYLGGLGLYPGAAVAVLEILPFDGPLRLRVGGAEHVVGRPLAVAVSVTHEGQPV